MGQDKQQPIGKLQFRFIDCFIEQELINYISCVTAIYYSLEAEHL